jgi:hypothetical protein
MNRLLLVVLVVFLSLAILTGCRKRSSITISFPQTKTIGELSLVKIHPIAPPSSTRFDSSGLTLALDGKTLLTVNDKLRHLELFSLLPGKNERVARSFWKATGDEPEPLKKGQRLRLDLEGVTSCQGAYLVISEQYREVFRLSPRSNTWTRHPIALGRYEHKARRRHPLPRFSLNRNAGYEGIACDEDGKRLFVIQERQPRMVFVIALPKLWHPGESLRVLSHFDLPSLELPRKVGKAWMEPDFAGASVNGGHLYVLYRNARSIQKVSLETFNQVAVASFRKTDASLYKNYRPYGLAEGIVVASKRIWIVYDSNGRRRKNNPADQRPVLLELKRDGF